MDSRNSSDQLKKILDKAMREQIKLTEIKIGVNQRFVQHKNLDGQKIKDALGRLFKVYSENLSDKQREKIKQFYFEEYQIAEVVLFDNNLNIE